MIIGKISKDEKKVKFQMDINCNNCGKKVPGGLQTGEKFYNSEYFKKELEKFMKTYLCGICRDKKRTSH